MTTVFADTFYYLSLLNPDDRTHELSVQYSQTASLRTITTAWILTEVGDALALPANRGLFRALIETLRANPNVTIVPPSPELFELGIDLYHRRPDKDWPLTDCISFVVMQQNNLTDALTSDHHFEQAGFKALLK
jgi:predicted nucleic acid-binding protein